MKTAQYPEDKMGTFTKPMLMATLIWGNGMEFFIIFYLPSYFQINILHMNWNFGATHIPYYTT